MTNRLCRQPNPITISNTYNLSRLPYIYNYMNMIAPSMTNFWSRDNKHSAKWYSISGCFPYKYIWYLRPSSFTLSSLFSYSYFPSCRLGFYIYPHDSMGLLDLPPEIRLRIYDFCFPPPDSFLSYWPKNNVPHLNVPPPLYLVCKTILNELPPLKTLVDFWYPHVITDLCQTIRRHCEIELRENESTFDW